MRAPAAQRAGVRSGICFPVVSCDTVVGTMDSFTTDTLTPSDERLAALRAVGELVSQAFGRVAEAETQRRAAGDVAAINSLLRELSRASTVEPTITTALETIRREFDWHHASYWALDENSNTLRLSLESGDLGAEFRSVSRTASFARGVGVAGRTWAAGELVFVEDLGEVDDCVRAPAARGAGVRSGVCLPISVGGRVVGTMDFFATRTLVMADSRRDALCNTAFLISQSMERLAATERVAEAGREVVASIEEVERNVAEATTVAADGQRVAGEATDDVSARVAAIQTDVQKVVGSLAAIRDIVDRINETQHLIGGVLTEQSAVTRSIVELS